MKEIETLPERYAGLMAIHGHGHGLYETESASHLRPGTCGYIDSTGHWQHIVNLLDRKELDKGGYTSIEYVKKAEAAEAPAIEAGTTVSGAPVEAVARFELESSVESGAVLLCNKSVFLQGYAHEEPFRKWARKNMVIILKNCPDVKNYGFFIVKTTWTSEDVWINTWTKSKKGVSISFAVSALGAGKIAPSFEYRHGHSAGGWVHPEEKLFKTGMRDKRVLFFKGLKYEYILPSVGIVKAWAKERRGEDESEEEGEAFEIEDPDNENVHYAVKWHRVGKD